MGGEGFTVHRSVEHLMCDHARTAQAGDEGGGFQCSCATPARNRSPRAALP